LTPYRLVRREHFIKGKTEIVRDLKVSRNTVRKVLRSGETSFEYERQVQPRPKLGQWAVELDGLLRASERYRLGRPVDTRS
jgi:predicted transcriptional regulator